MDDFFDPESEALIVKPSSSLSSIRQSNTYHRHHHQPKYQNQWAQLFQSDQDSSQRQNISGHDANPDVHKQKRTPTNEGPPNKAHTNVSHLTSKFSFYVWTASFVGCLVLEAVSVIGFFLYGLHVSIALSLSTMAAFLFFAMSIVGQANKGISSLPIPQYNLVIIVMFGMLAGLIGGISAAAPLSEYYSSHNNIHHPSFSISRLASTTTALPLTPAAAAPPPPSSSPSSHTTIPVLPPSAQTVIHFGDGASAEGKEEGNAGKGSGKAFADASRGITYANPIGYSAGTGVLCISPIVSSLEQSKVLFWAMNRGDFSCDLPAKCVDCDGIVLNHVPTAQSSAAVKQAVSQYNLDVDASTPPTFLLWTNDVEAQLAGFLHSGLLFLGLPFLVFPVAAMTMVGFSLLFAVMNMKVFDHRV